MVLMVQTTNLENRASTPYIFALLCRNCIQYETVQEKIACFSKSFLQTNNKKECWANAHCNLIFYPTFRSHCIQSSLLTKQFWWFLTWNKYGCCKKKCFSNPLKLLDDYWIRAHLNRNFINTVSCECKHRKQYGFFYLWKETILSRSSHSFWHLNNTWGFCSCSVY